MFEVRFYKFNKKINSTKLPNVPYVTEFCNIKTPTSYTNTIIEIEKPSNIQGILDWNYCYIVPFHRYYFISNITFDMGVWVLDLKEDVLATFKEDILDSEQFILRSTNKYDVNIRDDYYLSKNYNNSSNRTSIARYESELTSYPKGAKFFDLKTNIQYYSQYYFDTSFEDGYFCVGVLGGNATGVTYYAMSYYTFKRFIQEVCTLVPSQVTEYDDIVANAIYNPLQYVTSAIWYPHIYATGDEVNEIKVGSQSITLGTNTKIIDIDHIPLYYCKFTIPKHPSGIEYMNLSPYSEINLFFQPFGIIPLDTSKLQGLDEVYVSWTIDYTTGTCQLFVMLDHPTPFNYSSNQIIATDSASYGCPVSLSSMNYDWKVGLGLSAMSWLKSSLSGNQPRGLLSNYVNDVPLSAIDNKYDDTSINISGSGVTSFIDTAMGVLSSSMGQLQSKGTSGSYMMFNMGTPYIYTYFYNQTTQYPEKFGRPYHKKDKLRNINDFCVCKNAYIETYKTIKPLLIEQTQIENFLNSGFYIE